MLQVVHRCLVPASIHREDLRLVVLQQLEVGATLILVQVEAAHSSKVQCWATKFLG